jgi:hypothetical protein
MAEFVQYEIIAGSGKVAQDRLNQLAKDDWKVVSMSSCDHASQVQITILVEKRTVYQGLTIARIKCLVLNAQHAFLRSLLLGWPASCSRLALSLRRCEPLRNRTSVAGMRRLSFREPQGYNSQRYAPVSVCLQNKMFQLWRREAISQRNLSRRCDNISASEIK